MKRTRCTLLLTLLFCAGLFAQTDSVTVLDPVHQPATTAIMDSIAKMYRMQGKNPKELMLLQKLSADQIIELEKMEMERRFAPRETKPVIPIPLIITLCLLPFAFAVFFFTLYFKNRNTESQRKQEIYLKALEMGQPVPEIIFSEEKKKKVSRWQTAFVWLGVGIGVFLASILMRWQAIIILGTVPMFVGLGLLIAYGVEKSHERYDKESQDRT